MNDNVIIPGFGAVSADGRDDGIAAREVCFVGGEHYLILWKNGGGCLKPIVELIEVGWQTPAIPST